MALTLIKWIVSSALFILLSSAPTAVQGAAGKTRHYYVGIVEDLWDYTPTGQNLINGKDVADDEHASVFLERGPHRIGSKYKKAMFREYTNASYTHEAPRPAWLGYVGPILRAEVDDVIMVHLKNFASRNYSMHPHGVLYEKDHEGALYPDGTSGKLKEDDGVPPGGNYTYHWVVKPEFAPTKDDANCLTWVYHSHVDAPRDISSGLIGALLTCKKGILKETPVPADSLTESVRNDVDQDVFLLFNVVDEALSWYLDDNIKDFCSDPGGVDKGDPDFEESNLMHAINGYMYGNLPGIELCQHRAVAWHLFGMGNEVDIHSAYFYGNTLLDRGHRADVLSLFPATFVTAEMLPLEVGKWLLTCQVNDHLQAGMQAFYEVKSCTNASAPAVGNITRSYYLAAEEVEWDYGPSGKNTIFNISLTVDNSPSEVFFGRDGGRLGGRYKKVVYTEYTDSTFTTRREKPANLGILGPVLRAEEGDILQVTFMNNASRNYSIQPHGLHYDKHFQGVRDQNGTDEPGSAVAPGTNFTYIWKVLDGPSPSDPNCIPYLYFSGTDAVHDTSSGLMGPLLVCRKGALGENGTQKGVDKEMFLLFTVMDENESWYLDENILKYGSNATNETDTEDEDFQESNKMHAVNGLVYGNLLGLDLCLGDTVVWYNFGLGTEVDIHGIYFQGNTFQRHGTTRDTLNLFPHTTATMLMKPTTPGRFIVNCRLTDHFSGGMFQSYSVQDCPGHNFTHTPFTPRKVVQYFISAEEIEWDYSPDRSWEQEKNHGTLKDSPGNVFLERRENRIGSRYKKAVYRAYTDDTFTTQKERQPQEMHLGILGPIIKAEVGEQILIMFKNNASRPYSISGHGIKAPHVAPVQPGYMTEIRWDIPESSGPGVSDPNCISFAYFSSTHFKDMYSGLVGPLVVCRRGTLSVGEGADRQRADVKMDFALLFLVFDENQSWYIDDNIRTYIGKDPEAFVPDPDFEESNMMHAINGRLYGNLQGLEMTQGQKVDWYLLGLGSEVDMHTVHFHAETFTYKMDGVHRADVFDLFPGTFQTVEMVVGNPGTWLLHCHVTDHLHAGMETTFTIKESPNPTPTPTPSPSPGKTNALVSSIATMLLSLAVGVMLHY